MIGWDAGNSGFDQITNASGYVTITGKPGTWHFTISKTGYKSVTWDQSITSTTTKHAFFTEKEQACTDQALFVSDITVPDNTQMNPGQNFTKTWRLRNSGTCTWSTAYQLVFSSGAQMGAPSAVSIPTTTPPNSTVDISVPMTAPTTAGTYTGYWRMRNASGQIFSGDIWVKIIVVAACTDQALFVSDVTVPDNTQMSPGQSFTKIWRMCNSGSCTWTTSYQLVFWSGAQMGAPNAVSIATTTPPNSTVDISVPMIAPATAGTYTGYWRMRNASGQVFTSDIWVKIVVTVPTCCFTLSGRVTNSAGTGLTGVVMTLSGSASGSVTTVGGNYSFSGLANGTYMVTPSLPGWTF